MTQLIYNEDVREYDEEEHVENYPVKLILSHDGYFKKITMASLRGNDEQKFKDGDMLRTDEDAENLHELLFFSDRAQVYKAKVADFEPTKASVLGDFIPAKLGFDAGERCIAMKGLADVDEDNGTFVFLFANGKGVRIPASAYATKSNRRKLTGAYSDAAPCVGIFYLAEGEEKDLLLVSSAGKGMLLSSALIPLKTTRSSAGVSLMTLKKDQTVIFSAQNAEQLFDEMPKIRKTKIPATPAALPEGFVPPYSDLPAEQ